MPEQEWDRDANLPEGAMSVGSDDSGLVGYTGVVGEGGPLRPVGNLDGLALDAGTNMYTGRSGYATWATATGVQETNTGEWTVSYDTVSGIGSGGFSPVVTIANEEIKSEEIEIHPVHQITNNGNRFIQPIKYTFNNQSWKYTLAYACSIFFGPWLIILSKLSGRSTGFRIKNSRWV